jgi:hypothetical protein
MPGLYKINRSSHRILNALSASPTDLYTLFGRDDRFGATAEKLRGRLCALRDDGLVTQSGPVWALTAEGEAVLARLDAGEPVEVAPVRGVANCRVFA